MRTSRAVSVALLAALATASVAACSSDSTESSSTGGSETVAACEPSGEDVVNLSFTSWIPGIEDAVAKWNEQNPDIQVAVQTGPNGNSGTYQNFFNQLKAGNAPDLGQIEYDALASFRVQGGLQNIGGCDVVQEAQPEFIDWTWDQVSFGEEGNAYAIPQDTGPMALFYRADLFEEAGIAVPVTWDEYAEAAEKIDAEGGKITNFSTADINQFAGFAWQNGASWFEADDEGWTVNITGAETEEVGAYWQDLIERDLVASYPAWTDEWNNAYNSSEVWTWVSAVWGANTIQDGAPDTAGNWAVAPMPQWDSAAPASGNWGGSSIAVFTGTDYPYEAAKFATWLNTSEESLTILADTANIYPATLDGINLPTLQSGVDFYGGQVIWDVFAQAANQVPANFTWGPTMTDTYASISDGFKQVVTGNSTVSEALTAGEESTVSTMNSQSIPVKE
ncbi:ABC transporter substrate-binding protein [Jonesia quinghaiensis]|uniref:ABC transporter substrate-binding protein n=1 Tax=Jonesia quinghaiensis TaxID=262806 RepID=UPI00048DD91C|nr:extracellular solute-binding protein [Jonesia quinghaiensis]